MADAAPTNEEPLTPEELTKCGWKQAMEHGTWEGYSGLSSTFEKAAKEAEANGDTASYRALILLARVCSMMLKPESHNDPYKPLMVMHGRRSMIPEDLTGDELTLFAGALDAIDDPLLKARLADLLWLRREPRDPQFALTAIDAYCSTPVEPDSFLHDGRECWERGLALARLLGSTDRLEQLQAELLERFKTSTTDDGFFVAWLAEVLEPYQLDDDVVPQIASHLRLVGSELEQRGELYQARVFYLAAARWCMRSKDHEAWVETTVAVAESWVTEAAARLKSSTPSHMVAGIFYEKSIQTYRSIPGKDRAAHNVDERIKELHRLMNESNARASDEMSVIKSEPIDLRDAVEAARESVRGKATIDALRAFVNLEHPPQVQSLRKKALKRLQEHPIQGLISGSTRSSEGRVVAKHTPLTTSEGVLCANESAIHHQMMLEFSIQTKLVVQGRILPAHEVLLQEHRIRELDFVGLARESPIVPPDRVFLFGKALFSGYDRDFATAIHLLVPQIENLVRYHLKEKEIKTTTLDSKGIEMEVGLSALMEKPEITEILGKDIAFEVRALFCDPVGANLRNQVAHGLLGDSTTVSADSIYAWWLALRLVFVTLWNALHKTGGGDSDTETERAKSEEKREQMPPQAPAE